MATKISRPSRYRLALLRALANDGGMIYQYYTGHGRKMLWWMKNDFYYFHMCHTRTVQALREAGYLQRQGRSHTVLVLSRLGRRVVEAYPKREVDRE